MREDDIYFSFSDVTERRSTFSYRHNAKGINAECLLAVNDQDFLVSGNTLPSIAADLLDIAAAVSAVDRLVCNQDSSINIYVSLPLRNPAVFNEITIKEKLSEILYWYTENNWIFQFSMRNSAGRLSESQQSLFSDRIFSSIALWSGGLDAFAGGYNYLQSSVHNLSLIGVSTSRIVHRSLRVSGVALSKEFPLRTEHVRIPIIVARTSQLPKNNRQRARGFVFLLVGVAYAMTCRSKTLKVFENGYGAINSPFTSAEVGLDHARPVHPLSLYMVSNFIGHVTDTNFRITNPYVFLTKDRMLAKILMDGKGHLISKTSSCDRRRREIPSQCGMCSSCLLRQLSLLSNGLNDNRSYAATKYAYLGQPVDLTHFRAMSLQATQLRQGLSSADAWRHLSERDTYLPDTAVALSTSHSLPVSEVQSRLIELYRHHVNQWFVHEQSLAVMQLK